MVEVVIANYHSSARAGGVDILKMMSEHLFKCPLPTFYNHHSQPIFNPAWD